ncbi:MAG: hypothetical protein Q9217_000851 [Psora testacea]
MGPTAIENGFGHDQTQSHSFAAGPPSVSHDSHPENGALEPIAAIGFSLKFPQDAVSPDAFWQMLKERRCNDEIANTFKRPLLMEKQALVGGANVVYGPDVSQTSISVLVTAAVSVSTTEPMDMAEAKALVSLFSNGYQVLSGTATRYVPSNQDGRTPGITQPSTDAQLHLIRETYRKAGLELEPTRYVEAHGTGTAIRLPVD